jgi:hypothetical protein
MATRRSTGYAKGMPRRPLASLFLCALLAISLERPTHAQLPVTFHAPHTVRASTATLAPELARTVDAAIREAAPDSIDAALHLALDATGQQFHFGLGHPTTLAFGAKEREGNCIEYAHLFALIFARATTQRGIAARAYVVHSADARVLGEKLGARGLGDHDWVLVVGTAGPPRRLFVDPTFFDFGLGWDIAAAVAGDVRAP